MKAILKLITFFTVIFPLYIQGQEQDNVPFFTPPSPTAYELGKYGQIPVGMFTGTANIQIPLYVYKTRNLTVPITLSYNSNGIKVDQIESNVGLGWSLNAGGVITKIVRDKPDEENKYFYPESDISLGSNRPLAAQFFKEASDENVDTETDLFMFNFAGKSGKFVYDNNKNIVLIPYQDIKIEPYIEESKVGYKITTSDGVQYIFLDKELTKSIIDGGGHSTGVFLTTAWYLSKIIHPSGDVIEFVYEDQTYNCVISLSQTLDVIYPLQYACDALCRTTPTVSAVLQHISYISGKKLVEISSNIPEFGKIVFESNQADPEINGYNLISKISVQQDKDLNLIDKFDFEYLTTANNRIFLKTVTCKDITKVYQLDYYSPDLLTSRLSYSQDHWGYYNAANNSCFVPKITNELPFADILLGADREPNGTTAGYGLLSQITYPTKGYSQLIYEPNMYYGDKIIPGHKNDLYLEANTGTTPAGTGNDATETLNCVVDQRVSITVSVNFNSVDCDPVQNTGHNRATLQIEDQDGHDVSFYTISPDGFEVAVGNVFGPTINNVYADLKKGNTYTIILHPAYMCVLSNAYIHYQDTPPATIQTNIITGGMRISKIISHDPVQNKDNIARYYYGSKSNISTSSGDPGQKAFYISYPIDKIACTPPATSAYSYINHKVLSSSSLTPIFNTGNNNIYYQYVTVSQGGDNFENGGEEHEFIVDRDLPGNLIWGQNNIPSAPWTNFGWDNGLEKRISYFKHNSSGTNIVLKTITNDYMKDNRHYEEVKGYSVRKNYDLVMDGPATYTCKTSDLNRTYPYSYCAADHDHVWFCGFGETTCIAPGNENITINIPDPCYGKTAGTVLTFPENIANLDIVQYKNISYWSYLDYTVIADYDKDGLNPVYSTTNYYYDNEKHLQLTRMIKTKSNLDKIVTQYLYPDDYLIPANGFIKDMHDANIIDKPVESITYQTNSLGSNVKILAGKINTYNQGSLLGLPEKEWILETQTPIELANYKFTDQANTGNLPDLSNKTEFSISTKDSHYPQSEEFNYTYYDNGNISTINKTNDASISYLWGYNNTLPIAKVVNAASNQIAYTGFDNGDNDGGWTYTGTSNIGPNCGFGLLKSGGSVTKTSLPQGVYIISFIGRSNNGQGIVSITGSPNVSLTSNTNYYEIKLTGITSVTLSLNSFACIDELKLRPANSIMTTYTYIPLVGMTSSTDENNVTTYYEYDSFGRLLRARDNNGKILKEYQYHYINQ